MRDDSRKEIVVSFRGSFQLQDFVTGTSYLLLSYNVEVMKLKIVRRRGLDSSAI